MTIAVIPHESSFCDFGARSRTQTSRNGGTSNTPAAVEERVIAYLALCTKGLARAEIAKRLHVTRSTVRRLEERTGIASASWPIAPSWTPAEDEILLANRTLRDVDLRRLLPGRTTHGIRKRRERLTPRPKVAAPVRRDQPLPSAASPVPVYEGEEPEEIPCAWHVPASGPRGFRYCGAPALYQSSYCEEHRRAAAASKAA